MKGQQISGNEDGTMVVVGILVLTLLTVAGIAGTNMSSNEILIAGNDKDHRESFFRAEAAALQAGNSLENLSKDLLCDRTFPVQWIRDKDEYFMEDADQWDPEINSVETNLGNDENDDEDRRCPGITLFSAALQDVAKGGSLDVAQKSQMHEYKLFGFSKKGNEKVIILMGYKIRY